MPTALHWQSTRAFRDCVIISAVSILASVLVFVLGVFEAFQEWARNRREWTEWHIHDYVFVLVILTFASGIFALRRWRELGHEISERKRLEEERLILIAELNHHVRNALTAIVLYAEHPDPKKRLQSTTEAVDRIEWVLRELVPTAALHEGKPRLLDKEG